MFGFNMKKLTLWLLIIMVSGFAIGAAILFSTGSIGFSSEGIFSFTGKYPIEVNEEKTIYLEGINSLKVESVSTDINFILTDGNELRAHLHGGINSSRKDYIPELDAQTSGSAGMIKLKWPSGGVIGFYSSNLKLDIYIPSKYSESLEIASTSADITIGGLTLSNFRAGSVSGDFRIDDIKATDFSVGTTSGRGRINKIVCDNFTFTSISGDLTADTITAGNTAKLGTTSGNFRFTSLEGTNVEFTSISGDLAANGLRSQRSVIGTTSGKIAVENLTGDATISSVSGDVRVVCSNIANNISTSTASGDVDITLLQDSEFNLDFSTASGSYKNNFSMTYSNNSKRSVTGSSGNSSNTISVKTISGDLEIRKK